MLKNFLRYLKHLLLTVVVASVGGFAFLLLSGNRIKYNPNYDIADRLGDEGPFILYAGDSCIAYYAKGNETDGYYVERKKLTDSINHFLPVNYFRDATSFAINVKVREDFYPEPSVYKTSEPVLVISDIEGNYRTFRDFLVMNNVLDTDLNWKFGKGHVVLLGDFVDRGYFVTQVLWLIFHMEQQAHLAGGKVHYILGNHEIMNMQGDHGYAAGKYGRISAVLGVKQFELYNDKSLIGRWLNSKNTVLQINDAIFTHGGLHPEFSKHKMSLDTINEIIRDKYYTPYFPAPGKSKALHSLLFSGSESPYWYRGYFQDNVSVAAVDSMLRSYGASKIVVGHTVQSHVKTLLDGSVIAVDVEHPQEWWGSSFPSRESEGLLIERGVFYRLRQSGKREVLE